MEQQRTIPTYSIAGTIFIVDVEKEELRQVDRPDNKISFDEMDYRTTHYYFHYDTNRNNLPVSFTEPYETILLPNMTELDPEGMALKFGVEQASIAGKTDVEVINDPEQIRIRETGRQPVIEIEGHPFFVDIHWGLLRPKDDFSTLGISFQEIDGYLSEDGKSYQFPYDPKAHAFRELDYHFITSIPKDLVAVEIPSQKALDPIGYARKYDLDKNTVLRQSPLRMEMKARTVPWNETPIKNIIANNIKRDAQFQRRKRTSQKKSRGL